MVLRLWFTRFLVSLGDTIGVGSAGSIKSMLDAVLKIAPAEKLAVHFHDTYGQALTNILVSIEVMSRIKLRETPHLSERYSGSGFIDCWLGRMPLCERSHRKRCYRRLGLYAQWSRLENGSRSRSLPHQKFRVSTWTIWSAFLIGYARKWADRTIPEYPTLFYQNKCVDKNLIKLDNHGNTVVFI